MPAFRNPWFESGTAWLESAYAPSVPSLARTFAGFQSFQLKIAEVTEILTVLIITVLILSVLILAVLILAELTN